MSVKLEGERSLSLSAGLLVTDVTELPGIYKGMDAHSGLV